MARIVFKSKLVPKDLGNPRAAAGLPDGDTSILRLGSIVGVATGVKAKEVRRTMPNGSEEVSAIDAIVGNFRGYRAAPLSTAEGPIDGFQSSILYLPPGISELLSEPLRIGDVTSVEFAFHLSTRKASNLAGYEYCLEMIKAPTQSEDALDRLAEPLMKALPAPKPARVA